MVGTDEAVPEFIITVKNKKLRMFQVMPAIDFHLHDRSPSVTLPA